MSGKDLDTICRKHIAKEKRWGKLFLHSLGHGVGIQIHELPNCNPVNDNKLFVNSVITIEPGVYDPDLGGVRVEDTVVVTKDSCINLTSKASKDFI
jgi:Xaa-Pro aminopeptidase